MAIFCAQTLRSRPCKDDCGNALAMASATALERKCCFPNQFLSHWFLEELYSQSNTDSPMSCCSPMPYRLLCHLSLHSEHSRISVSLIIQQSFQTLAHSQTYLQTQSLQCCVALQWHKQSLQPLVMDHCKLISFNKCQPSIGIKKSTHFQCFNGCIEHKAGRIGKFGRWYCSTVLNLCEWQHENSKKLNKRKSEFLWTSIVQAIYRMGTHLHKTVPCQCTHKIMQKNAPHTPMCSELNDKAKSASHVLSASSWV